MPAGFTMPILSSERARRRVDYPDHSPEPFADRPTSLNLIAIPSHIGHAHFWSRNSTVYHTMVMMANLSPMAMALGPFEIRPYPNGSGAPPVPAGTATPAFHTDTPRLVTGQSLGSVKLECIIPSQPPLFPRSVNIMNQFSLSSKSHA